MNKIMYRRFGNFMGRSFSDKWLVVQVFVLLGVSRLAILILPLSRLQQLLGQKKSETPLQIDTDDLVSVRKVAWAVKVTSSITPWTSNCFPQAITAKILLHLQGLSSTLYLGAKIDRKSSGLRGHAWLRCGNVYLTGGRRNEQQYGAVTGYGTWVINRAINQ